MIELKNVSKFYHSNGNTAIGLHNASLKLSCGEFVAITGESGSGKSTLLNVLSGIDYYEEGDFYLNGEEISYYSNEQWEEYRNKNIGFVFQNYNLIDSYSVLENVEIALTLSGYDPAKKRKRALEIINRVGLSSHIKHKASKLSGGQKQRVVIARALAKDTPIIAADEPTGNLDSATSKSIIELLKEISKDKLVIIVTHDFKEIADCTTRKIRLFDGKIVEDTQLSSVSMSDSNFIKSEGKIKLIPKMQIFKIALKNLTSLPRKTFLVFNVLLAFTLIIGFLYINIFVSEPSQGESTYENYNNYPNRVLIKKQDDSKFSADDLDKISNFKYTKYYIENDFFVDITTTFTTNEDVQGENSYRSDTFQADSALPTSVLDEKDLTYGRLPINENEIVISFYPGYFYESKDFLNKEGVLGFYTKQSEFNYNTKYFEITMYKVVGIIEQDLYPSAIYLSNSKYYEYYSSIIHSMTENTFTYNNSKEYPLQLDRDLSIYGGDEYTFSDDVAYIDTGTLLKICAANYPELVTDINTQEESCKAAIVDNPSETQNLKIISTYKETTFYKEFTEFQLLPEIFDSYNINEFVIYTTDYITGNPEYTFDDVYQVSLFTNNFVDAQKLTDSINKGSNFTALHPGGVKNQFETFLSTILRIFSIILYIGFFTVIYFVTYMILKNILQSRNTDYVILRSLGSSKKVNSTIVFFEIWLLLILCYLAMLVGVFTIPTLFPKNSVFATFKYLRIIDFIILFIVISVSAYLLSARFNKKLFDNSIDTALRMY